MNYEEPSHPKVFYAAVVVGSFADLSVIDLSSYGVRFYNLKKPAKLKAVSKKLKPLFDKAYSLYNIIKRDSERIHENQEYLHALIPADFSNAADRGTYFHCVEMLKVAYPSDLQIHSLSKFHIKIDEIEWQGSSVYETYFFPEQYKNYLYFESKPDQIETINKYIVRYKERVESAPFIALAIDAYIGSFSDIPVHMSFLSLCIALESFVSGTTELIYRIKRTVALISADNAYTANIIFKNIGKFYDLRSKIIHGAKYDYSVLYDYHPKLRSLISRTIVQLIYSKIMNPDELQEQLNFAGFVDRKEIFEKDTISLNISSYANTLSDIAKKK